MELKSPVIIQTKDLCPRCTTGVTRILVDRSESKAVAHYCSNCGWTAGDKETLVPYLKSVGFTLPGTKKPRRVFLVSEDRCCPCGTPLELDQKRFCSMSCTASFSNYYRVQAKLQTS